LLFPHWTYRANETTGARELVVVRPYVIAYRLTDDQVIILRVWHTAQDRTG
jgi:plasmid stabilization system protein ParE